MPRRPAVTMAAIGQRSQPTRPRICAATSSGARSSLSTTKSATSDTSSRPVSAKAAPRYPSGSGSPTGKTLPDKPERDPQLHDRRRRAGYCAGHITKQAARLEDPAEDQAFGAGEAKVRPDAGQIPGCDQLVPPIVGRNRPRIRQPLVIDQSVRDVAVPKHPGHTPPDGRLAASHRPGQHQHRHHIENGVHAPIVAISSSRSGARCAMAGTGPRWSPPGGHGWSDLNRTDPNSAAVRVGWHH